MTDSFKPSNLTCSVQLEVDAVILEKENKN